MTTLADYREFDGQQRVTGPLRNVLAYQGIRAPHTGQPITEALLFGISGGIVAGYFTFEYQGHLPTLHFITRNTFDPLNTILEQLGIQTTVRRTDNPDKAVTNLTDALDAGKPALVWVDIFSLPYSHDLQSQQDVYMMEPVVVFGFDGSTVQIADRARVPLAVDADAFAAARARVKSNKYQMMTIDAVDLDRLPGAVEQGIHACIRSMTEKPPKKPMEGKFGLAAYEKWAELLVDSRSKQGWARQFAPGVRMYAGLTSVYEYVQVWDAGGAQSRREYADFLEEAAAILNKPSLSQAAAPFRKAARRWDDLMQTLLPEDIPLLQETRELMERDRVLFLEQGAAPDEREKIRQRLAEIENSVDGLFSQNDAEAAAARLREKLRERVLAVHDAEQQAVTALRDVMA